MSAAAAAVRAAAVQLCAAGRPALYKLPAAAASPDAGLVCLGAGDGVCQIGEDAVFVLRNCGAGDSVAFGVADGVGGWRDQGVDPGQASLALISASSDALKSQPPCLKSAMSSAHRGLLASRPELLGSTTLCLARLTPSARRLEVANLGDSGLCVLGAGTFGFKLRTRFQTNMGGVFNCPMQLAFPSALSRQYPRAEDCELYSVILEPGDIALMATDGLWDNLYQQTIEEIFRHAFQKPSSQSASSKAAGESPLEAAAKMLVDAATYLSAERNYFSPFCQSAKEAGLKYAGGKEDDISVVLARLRCDADTAGADGGDGPAARL